MAREHAAHRPALPHECRHHRRGADDEGSARPRARARRPDQQARRAGGRVLGEVEEYFAETLVAAATPSSSPARCCASRASCENDVVASRASRRHRPQDPRLCRRQVPALDVPGRARPRHAGRPPRVAPHAGRRGRMAGDAAHASPCCRGATSCWSRRSRAGAALPRRLPVRGAAGAPDARHAADAAAGAGAAEAAGLRGDRLWHRRAGAWRHIGAAIARGRVDAGRPVLAGHAGRRPRGMAGGIRPDEAHLPPLRHHRGADRAALSGPGEDAAGR